MVRGVADSMEAEGGCFNMSTWEILWGIIIDSSAAVSVRVHAWSWRGPFDLNENSPQRFCSLDSAQRTSQKPRPTSGFSQVSLQSVPSVIMGIPQPVALIHLCWHSLGPFGFFCGNSVKLCQQRQATSGYMLSTTEFTFISTLLYHYSV